MRNRRKILHEVDGLSRVAVVLANDPSKFGSAADLSFSFRNEVYVEYRVVAANPSMRSVLVVMPKLGFYDVVQLVLAEAHEMVQAFAFQCPDEAFTKCIRHWSARRNLDRPQFGILPERIEEWRNEYNEERPHSAINYQTPNAFRLDWEQRNNVNSKTENLSSTLVPN